MVERFLGSPRGAQLAAAKIIRREVEFLLPWPPEATRAARFFHGYIDCLYLDGAGAWRLLDYKTNRIAAGNVDGVANQYELQLLVYSLAVERALGSPPAEVALELLDPATERKFSWDSTARDRGIERINAAMESLQERLSLPRSAW
jgi:ATP-dependent helicase/nuclease subunit A